MVLTVLGAAYSIARQLSKAAPLIEKALLLNPNSAWTWQRSGWLNLYLGEYDLAIEHFSRCIRISPLDALNFNAFFGIGCSHFGSARYEEAVAWFRKAISARLAMSARSQPSRPVHLSNIARRAATKASG